MFESTYCEWCELWDEEVGVVYDKTPAGKAAPLKRLDIGDPRPASLQNIRRVVYTPTFVLVDSGREIGRINGYPGEGFFWQLLDQLLHKLENPTNGCPANEKILSDSNPTKEDKSC